MGTSQISRRNKYKRQVDKQKELGLCMIPCCKNKPEEYKKLCSFHLESRKKYYKNNKIKFNKLK